MTEPDVDATTALTALGIGPVGELTRITTGRDADTWRVRMSDGTELALRLLRAGRDGVAELAALRLARERGLPVPRVLASATSHGRLAIATQWCRGRPMAELVLAGADPFVLGRLLGRTQRLLHRPAADGSVLCHLDFHPYNVLVAGTDTDREVTGIVDWANARLGDAREDLATTDVVLAYATTELDAPDGSVAALADGWRNGYRGFPDRAELRPFLRAAAATQLATWQARVDAGTAPASSADAARRVAQTR